MDIENVKYNQFSVILDVWELQAKKNKMRLILYLDALVVVFMIVQLFLNLFVEVLPWQQSIFFGIVSAVVVLIGYTVFAAWETKSRYLKFYYEYKILYMSGLRRKQDLFWSTQYVMFPVVTLVPVWVYLSMNLVLVQGVVNLFMAVLTGGLSAIVWMQTFRRRFMAQFQDVADFRQDVVCGEYLLINEWTVIENIALPIRIMTGAPKHRALNEAQRCIDALMLNRLTQVKCGTLSYFQKLEVKIARAYACTGTVRLEPQMLSGLDEQQKKLISVLLERISSDKIDPISRPFGQSV